MVCIVIVTSEWCVGKVAPINDFVLLINEHSSRLSSGVFKYPHYIGSQYFSLFRGILSMCRFSTDD